MNPHSPSRMLAMATRKLNLAGCPAPVADARLMLCAVLDVSPQRLVLAGDATEEQAETFEQMIERRSCGEPVQYIVGHCWFRGRRLAVGPGVLIPRQETELVAGAVIDEARALAVQGQCAVVVDLCTGSGAIARAVAAEVPAALVHAVDNSLEALAWARRNLVDSRVQLHEGDARCVPDVSDVDIVVTNPPYIPQSRAADMPSDVLDHEPHHALFAGDQGMDLINALVPRMTRIVRPGGLVVMEHDDSHAAAVLALFGAGPWREVVDHDDLAGRPRYVTARRDQFTVSARQ